MLTTPPVKKIDLHFPLGLEVTARNLKGVTIKDALDAIHKQFKKRVRYQHTFPYRKPVCFANHASRYLLRRLMTSLISLTSQGSSGTRKSRGHGWLCTSRRMPVYPAAGARRRRTRVVTSSEATLSQACLRHHLVPISGAYKLVLSGRPYPPIDLDRMGHCDG